jgi:hypothetical protein
MESLAFNQSNNIDIKKKEKKQEEKHQPDAKAQAHPQEKEKMICYSLLFYSPILSLFSIIILSFIATHLQSRLNSLSC